jgi:cephalosporin hydroxylase
MTRRRKSDVVRDFSREYYRSKVWRKTFWFGLNCGKCPLDLWIFQEILHEMMPDLVIETGTGGGGSTLFMAHMMDLLGNGRILTIDKKEIDRPERHPLARPSHPRIMYLSGSSVSPKIEEQVRDLIQPDDTVMVDLDSAHGQPHVEKELELYSEFVTRGHYLIVEDTNVGHPVDGPPAQMGRGPWEAVGAFLKRHPEFRADRLREKFLLTHNPRGYLRRME